MLSVRPSVCVPAELQELIPRFLAHRRTDVAALDIAIARSDFEAARKIGHSLKGVGGGYGFDEISRVGTEIERAAREGRSEALRDLACSFVDYLDMVEIRFD